MAETYLWQGVPNQGYNKYGKGIIGPGSKESLDRAVNVQAGIKPGTKFPITDKGSIVPLEVLDKPTIIHDRWSGVDRQMKAGDIRMTYGQQPAAWMHPRWQEYAKAHGVETLLDQNASASPALMESTYRDAKTGEYLTGRLRKPGTVINAVKDANVGITIPTEEMTHLLDSEAVARGGSPVKLKPGMVIGHDALGVYSPTLDANFFKKNVPTDNAGKAVIGKLQKFTHIRDLADKYATAGQIPAESAEKYIAKAWKFIQKWATKAI